MGKKCRMIVNKCIHAHKQTKFQGTLLGGLKIKFPANSAHQIVFLANFVTGSEK